MNSTRFLVRAILPSTASAARDAVVSSLEAAGVRLAHARWGSSPYDAERMTWHLDVDHAPDVSHAVFLDAAQHATDATHATVSVR